MKLYKATLTANSYLYFYSTEFLKTTTVNNVLHHWALMFALTEIKADPDKKHLENLRDINYYCTPAIPREINKQSFIHNPVPEDTGAGKLGLMRIEKFAPGSKFQFLVLSKNDKVPPTFISYGKKKTSHSVNYEELDIIPEYKEKINLKTNNFINPLDFKKIDSIKYVQKYPLKPSPLYIVEGTFHDVFLLPHFKDTSIFPQVIPKEFPYSEWI